MSATFSQGKQDALLLEIFSENKDPLFQEILRDPVKYRLQIIYTKIERDKDNIPHFTHHTFCLDSNWYFNPASTVKLPVALLSLEKLHSLPKNVDRDTPLQIDSAYMAQSPLLGDPSSIDGKASIAHFIKRAFLVSENEPYNRLYEFLGQAYLNETLWKKGYKDTRITRRFAAFNETENRHTNPFTFLGPDGKVLYEQAQAKSETLFHFPILPPIGKAHLRDQQRVEGGMDFSRANNLPLQALQQMLQAVLFPASVPSQQRFKLDEDDYRLVYQYLSQHPGETNYPKYDEQDFYPSYAKFFFRDSTHHHLPRDLRVFNKVGWAYGFLTDASYVADFENKVEFMLAATIYTNENEVLNDGKYEYESIGHPFLYQLGKCIYQYELNRKRQYIPGMKAFKLAYESRVQDDRPALREKEIDN